MILRISDPLRLDTNPGADPRSIPIYAVTKLVLSPYLK